MKYLLRISFIASFLLILSSCNEDEATINPNQLQADTETIDKLITSFDNSVNIISSSNAKMSSEEIEEVFVGEVKAMNLNVRYGSASTSTADYSEAFNIFAAQIADATQFASAEAYQIHLQDLDKQVRTSNMNMMEKQTLVNRIALMDAFVDWMGTLDTPANKPGLEKAEDEGWWDSWGKCAAGTVGGAGLGALAGAGVGGAGCTVVLPIIGTVACGTVGGVVGGVSGALAGAAASC
jgi:hypothetical protein